MSNQPFIKRVGKRLIPIPYYNITEEDRKKYPRPVALLGIPGVMGARAGQDKKSRIGIALASTIPYGLMSGGVNQLLFNRKKDLLRKFIKSPKALQYLGVNATRRAAFINDIVGSAILGAIAYGVAKKWSKKRGINAKTN